MVWVFCGKAIKEEINAGESSEQRAYESLWPHLWKVDVPNKIKIFS